MYEALLELGWLKVECPERRDATERIRVRKEIESNISYANGRLESACWHMKKFLPQVVAKIGKHPDQISRLTAVRDRVCQEDSLRGKILRSFNRLYSNDLSRSDF